MTTIEILQKYAYIINEYCPASDSVYVDICEAILKAYHTYNQISVRSFEEYAKSCIESQLAKK